jgi:hypothetical protein
LFSFFYMPDMTLTTLGVLANLALAASPVLLPPTITAADLGEDNAFEGLVIDPFKRAVYVECDTCALAVQEENKISWKEKAGNTFVSSSPLTAAEVDEGYQHHLHSIYVYAIC